MARNPHRKKRERPGGPLNANRQRSVPGKVPKLADWPLERTWLAPWVAAALATAVYAPSLAGGLIYDDVAIVLRSPAIRELHNLGAVLRYEPARPLLGLSWAISYALGGAAPWHYHLVNVVLHAANAALLASLFLWMAQHLGWKAPRRAALLGACLFAVSPMAADTAAYVASRSTALVTLLGLASLRVATTGLPKPSPARTAGAVWLFLLALATKEEAAAVPLMLLLLDYFFVAGRRWQEVLGRWRFHAWFLGWLPLGLLARFLATGRWLPQPAVDTSVYLLTQWAAFPLYLLRALIPLDPALYRWHPPVPWPPDGATLAWATLTLAVAAVAIRLRHDAPEWSFAVAFLAVGLIPSSTFVALNEMVADHRAYFGSAGIAFALGGLLARVRRARLAVALLVLLSARTVQYEWVLSDPIRAWQDVVTRNPESADALCALGEAYEARDDARAEDAFRKAIALSPGNARYWSNLGLFLAKHDRLSEAIAALKEACQHAPANGAMRNFLGQLLLRVGREDEARLAFEAAVKAAPYLALPRANLASLLMRSGRTEEARQLLAAAAPLARSPQEAAIIAALRDQLPPGP